VRQQEKSRIVEVAPTEHPFTILSCQPQIIELTNFF